ncbi:Ni/Fe hydrogenase subunit alpha [Actinocrinis puniceicyclus]|uniref:Ni/Fe hydrogenase subunit alpha n=1 Tax=Actinocrinis puniceicyclus TaxID=977794 RepID=A0A8J8B971_9ACTN|nr:Ni/Fe hydrogenase subunit alpha [Actinocrinis puniceicyclus]MBS2961522.1 Ni/Fe hydrogenase subunit alpha [Actinocrinis puniceicyclus]
MTSRQERLLEVGSLARVEGEGALHLVLDRGRVTEARLNIYEPPRFFEAFLRGRSYTEVPDITARACEMCPVAYQLSACRAIEDAFGVSVGPDVRSLRRLLYCGEWIENHALHIHLLHAPDFLGYPDATELAKDHRAVVARGLALKKTGNDLVELVGGRAIHPVNVRVGGFHRAPPRSELDDFKNRLDDALEAAVLTVRWVAGFEFPDFQTPHALLTLDDPGPKGGARSGGGPRYPIDAGDGVITTAGIGFPLEDFEHFVSETQVAHSTALHARLRGVGTYLTGPLARYNLAGPRLWPVAADAARSAGLGRVERNPFRSVLVRAVELVQAVAEARAIIESYTPPDPPAAAIRPRAGRGYGATEAPRGLLYHRYDLDEQGVITAARIVPPTAQNQAAMEADLRLVAQAGAQLTDAQLTARCEQAIRNYDPCVSCSTHFLRLHRDERRHRHLDPAGS